MSCGNGSHGALIKKGKGWFCMVCGEPVDEINENELNKMESKMEKKKNNERIRVVSDRFAIIECKEEEKKSGFISGAIDTYKRGVIVSSTLNGVKSGDNVVFLENMASKLGLNFPEEYFVVESDSIVGVICAKESSSNGEEKEQLESRES